MEKTKETLQRENNTKEEILHLALELSNTRWKLASSDGKKVRSKTIDARNLEQLQEEIGIAKQRFKLDDDVRIVSCYEAGRDGLVRSTEEEFLKLLMAADQHDRNLLIACATTGGRRSEILRWTWTEDINFAERQVRLGNRKNRAREMRYRWIDMNDELFAALQYQYKTRLPQSDYVFQNRALWKDKEGNIVRKHPNYGDRFTARRRFMKGLCKKAGVREIGFHALRRFFGSLLADNREKLPTIQKLLGHAQISTTDRYIHRLKDDSMTAVNKISFKEKHIEEAHKKKNGSGE